MSEARFPARDCRKRLFSLWFQHLPPLAQQPAAASSYFTSQRHLAAHVCFSLAAWVLLSVQLALCPGWDFGMLKQPITAALLVAGTLLVSSDGNTI